MTAASPQPGRLYGVGVGPGDPELMTVKAVRVLGEADVIAHFCKAGRHGNGNTTIDGFGRPDALRLALAYPVTTEIPRHDPGYRDAIRDFYEGAAETVAGHLAAGRTVAVVSEGDPLFYGSYMHLHVRLCERFPTEVIPGVTAFSGAAALAGVALAQGDDVLVVLPGTLPEDILARRLAESEAAIVMKLGRNLPKVRRALAKAGLIDRAYYVERATMATGAAMRLCDKLDDTAPYFSLILVPGWETKP